MNHTTVIKTCKAFCITWLLLPIVAYSGNNLPTADAGNNVTYVTMRNVTLNGSGSNANDDGQNLTYAWEQISGVTVDLSDPTVVNPQFESPKLFPDESDIELVFSLVVNDGIEDSVPDTVTITIQPYPAAKPVFNAVTLSYFVDPSDSRKSLGDLLFAPDGNSVQMIVGSEDSDSVVLEASVERGEDMSVIGFGTWQEKFSAEYLDTGLEYAPNSDTVFYFLSDEGIGQRTTSGVQEVTAIQNYESGYGGLAVIPEQYSNAGQIIKAEYDAGRLFLHAVTDDGDGTFTISQGSLVAELPFDGNGDIHYITSGLLANHIAVAGYGKNNSTVYLIAVDPQTGLPDFNPQITVLMNNSRDAWGLTTDPITGHFWLVEYGADTLTQFKLDEVIFKSNFETQSQTPNT